MNLLAYVHLRNIHGSTGAGRVARQLVEHLDRRPGINMRVLADVRDHERTIPLVGRPWLDYRYQFFGRETSKQQAEWFLFDTPTAEHYWPETDVVFCTGESYVPVKRARLAVTLHDAAFFEQGAHRTGSAFWKQKFKWKLLYGKLARRADLFHTVSNFSAERLAHFFPSLRSRLRVVHNAVPPRFFEPVSLTGQEYLRREGLCAKPFVLLPRGLAHRKNAELVLRAWPLLRERHRDLQLVVTSHCDEPFVSRARALGSSVKLTGFVSDEALCSLYHAARVVWFPSLYEGFGLPVLEAMACGTPVVASNSSSLPEISGGAATLVSPDRDDEHIEAISALLDDHARRREQSERGIEHARRFTWAASAERLHGYLSELA
jgi:glycosyltransferase involved in cell wall biosynthesis